MRRIAIVLCALSGAMAACGCSRPDEQVLRAAMGLVPGSTACQRRDALLARLETIARLHRGEPRAFLAWIAELDLPTGQPARRGGAGTEVRNDNPGRSSSTAKNRPARSLR